MPVNRLESDASESSPLHVALVACGLGRIRRGFETTALNWHRALEGGSRVRTRLYGGAAIEGVHAVPNFSRNGLVCRCLRRLGLIHDGCRVEQATFAVGFLPSLLFRPADVIWFQEYTLGLCLLKLRRWFGFRYRLVYCNGAPLGPSEYWRFDFIHHLDTQSYRDAVAAGLAPSRMELMPHVLPAMAVATRGDGMTWRRAQGIPDDAWVVLSVAAWNRYHKRIDYVVREVAAMSDRNVHLLLCGQREAETAGIEALAEELLPGRVHWRTLPQNEMPLAYAAADAFVLASLTEAFGLVLIEAAARGVPVLAHQHPAAQFILESDLWLGDFSAPGSLSARLAKWKADPSLASRAKELQARISTRFSADVLTPQFVALLQRAASLPIGTAKEAA